MSDQVDASEEILEGASEVAEGVAQMARGFSGLALSGAFLAGAAVGGAAGYFVAKKHMQTKYRQIADEAIEEIREHYYRKDVARSNDEKPDLETIVREQGYSTEEPATSPPMAVTPPSAVVAAAQEDEDEDEGPGDGEEDFEPFPEPDDPRVISQNAFEQFGDSSHKVGEWDWHKEKRGRSPLRPYVIHLDEREGNDEYDRLTFTYFAEDDVLCDETDDVLDKDDRERLVGEANLDKFGHGSGDPTVVYIRNDQQKAIYEVCLSPRSYEEEVVGTRPPEIRHSDRRRERRAFDDE